MRGRKPIGEQTMTAAERQKRRRSSEAYRRAKPIKIEWDDAALGGRVYVGGEYWAAVEWSPQRHAWCIEDAEGMCLAHAEHIRGRAKSKELAIELAEAMIRDGRMPTPEEAKRQFVERLAVQAATPRPPLSPEARMQLVAEHARLTERWQTEEAERQAAPLWAAMHDIFDFGDPDLWRSNSFAVLRPRLILHVKAVIATCEKDREIWATRRQRQPGEWRQRRRAETESKLDRAREVLAALESA